MARKRQSPKVTQPRAGILGDHRQQGKRFIPPMADLVAPLHEIRWVDRPLPELLWIGALIDQHGLRRAADLALRLSQVASQVHSVQPATWFAPASNYTRLNDAELSATRNHLADRGLMDDLVSGLKPLLSCYPECPLSFLLSPDDRGSAVTPDAILQMRRLVDSLLDRRGDSATIVQANAIYIAFAADLLKAVEGTALANFPAMEGFPATEESQKVASSVRSATLLFFRPPHYDDTTLWPRYFWNRGFALEPCLIER